MRAARKAYQVSVDQLTAAGSLRTGEGAVQHRCYKLCGLHECQPACWCKPRPTGPERIQAGIPDLDRVRWGTLKTDDLGKG